MTKIIKSTAVYTIFIFLFVNSQMSFADDCSFYDDFNDGNYDGWTVIYGTWVVNGYGYNGDGGYLKTTSASGSDRLIRANTSAGFGTYEYYALIDGFDYYDSIIRINFQDDSNYVHVKLHVPGDSRDRISVWKDGVRTILTEVSEGLTFGSWAHVKIERLLDGVINVYIDGNLHMTAKETLVTAPGDIAFSGWGNVCFDNICYTPAGDFDVDAEPEGAKVEWYLGLLGTATYNVTVSSENCYSGTVNLSATGFPVGYRRHYFDPNEVVTVSPRSSATVKLVIGITSRTPVGDYTLTISGDNGDKIHSDDVILEVERPTRGRGPFVTKDGLVPGEFILSQNYPNPFNPETRISYQIPSIEGQDIQHVTLKVYDTLGREVQTLVDENKKAGYYTTILDGNDVASGVYFYRLEAGDFIQTRRMLLLK